jgi:hypothetical protein
MRHLLKTKAASTETGNGVGLIHKIFGVPMQPSNANAQKTGKNQNDKQS